MLAPMYPIEKIILWLGLLHLTSGSEADKGAARTNNRARDPVSQAQFVIHRPIAIQPGVIMQCIGRLSYSQSLI